MERALENSFQKENCNTSNYQGGTTSTTLKKKKKPVKKVSVSNRPVQIEYRQTDKWEAVNDMVQKAGFGVLDIHPEIGPREEGLIGIMYTMLREVQMLRSKVQNGDHPEIGRLDKENYQLRALSQKQEQTMFVIIDAHY
jgi:hypothetical protein